jgi:hypothetical protein
MGSESLKQLQDFVYVRILSLFDLPQMIHAICNLSIHFH